jgi:methyl coenzyme M reductase subunit D
MNIKLAKSVLDSLLELDQSIGSLMTIATSDEREVVSKVKLEKICRELLFFQYAAIRKIELAYPELAPDD